MRIHTILFLAASLIVSSAFIGCSSSEESTDDLGVPPQGEFQRIDADDEITPIITDTDASADGELPTTEKNVPTRAPEPQPAATQETPPAQQTQPARGMMMWSVQIGAFKVESCAIALVNEAKAKFNQPVYKDFDPVTNFYKVNVGSFSTREQAAQFKLEVQSKGYPDAFTVEARR
jgi:cell division septation protein DedD